MTTEHLDVVIIGAGISGIGAAYHLQKKCPGKSYAILEGRDAIGGTWNLFKYPGIRSDSDMYTFGYAFRPWPNRKSIADADSIIQYLDDTMREYGIDKNIRFRHRIIGASWSTGDGRWTLEVQKGEAGETVTMTCNFLFMCTGYYNYKQGYLPDFPGRDRFKGQIVHPQDWTDDVQYEGKRVVVIGSGATAITLIPALAEKASHVVMLQRSPSYVVARPNEGGISKFIRAVLPKSWAYAVMRWIFILLSLYFYQWSRRNPKKARKFILDGVRKELGPDYDVEKHFGPSYKVWDQRVCLTPDGDFFEAIREGRASVVTDHIDTFTETGVRTRSGEEIEADLIVTATGLNVQLLADVPIRVDGETINPSKSLLYKGVMFSDIPNLAWTIGYTNSSWTLKADLVADYVARIMKYMDRNRYRQCVPRLTDPDVRSEEFFDFTSGYVQRAQDILPKQGNKLPWRLRQNYLYDVFILRYGKINDGTLTFS